MSSLFSFFFFQAEDGIRDLTVTGVQTCALPIYVAVQNVARLLMIVAVRRRAQSRQQVCTQNIAGHLSSIVCVWTQLRELRVGDADVLVDLVNIDVVETGKLVESRAVSRAEAEEFADAWFGDAVFE